MSTTFEKVSAQAAAFSVSARLDHGRHLIGPVELKQLFDEVDRLRERIRRLEEALEAVAVIAPRIVRAIPEYAHEMKLVAKTKEAKP
jgi:hypothetical protein